VLINTFLVIVTQFGELSISSIKLFEVYRVRALQCCRSTIHGRKFIFKMCSIETSRIMY